MRSSPVVVCIPARNEADRLPTLVRSLAAQRLAPAAALRVVVVANNCTDATLQVLHDLRRDHDGMLVIEVAETTLPPALAHVGSARRLAMDCGADWLEREEVADGVLLTTDADATAPPDWVAANLAALKSADLVGGRLRMEMEDEGDDEGRKPLHDRIERYWVAVRALEQAIDPPPHDPDPRHGDHTAASLALSVALYRRVGGLPTLACGEDNALVARVRNIGGRVRHCPRVEIVVSPRRAGRVEGGMADEMRRRSMVTAAGGGYLLPAGDHWRLTYEHRAALRRAWERFAASRDESGFERLGLNADDLIAIAPAACPNDIAFLERAMQRDSQQTATAAEVSLEIAIAQLEALLDRHAANRRLACA